MGGFFGSTPVAGSGFGLAPTGSVGGGGNVVPAKKTVTKGGVIDPRPAAGTGAGAVNSALLNALKPAPVAAAPAAPAVSLPAGPVVNATTPDPGLTAALQKYTARTEQQQAREGVVDPNLQKQIDRVGESLSTDETQRMIDRATSGARDQLAGIGTGLQTKIAATQGDNPFARNNTNSRLAAAAARAGAKASADITMGERARKDALILGSQGIMAAPGQEKLTREGATNALISGGVTAAQAPANLALDQQRLGLDQYNSGVRNAIDVAMANSNIANAATNTDLARRQAQTNEFLTLLKAAGY